MQQRILAILLLIILIFNIFRYEIPYIQYAIFKEYIAENLCVNKDKPQSCCEGKCFRDKQVKVASEVEQEESTTGKTIPTPSQNKEIKEFLFDRVVIPEPTAKTISLPLFTQIIFCSKYISTPFIPPQI